VIGTPRKPTHVFKMFGVAHPGRNMCMSQPTEGKNLVVVQHAWETVYKDRHEGLELVKCLNECFGNKLSIDEYIASLRKGDISNLDAEQVNCCDPPVKVEGGDDYWARCEVTFRYKTKNSGMHPLLTSLGMDTTSSLVIFDGEEFSFVRSVEDIDDPMKWSQIRESIASSGVFSDMKRSRRVWSDDAVATREIRALRLLPGAISAYPMKFGDKEFLSPYYLKALVELLRALIQKGKIYSGSPLDDLLDWTPTHEELFTELYERDMLRPKITTQDRSFVSFCEILKKNGSPLAKHHPNTLANYARVIQETLDRMHGSFVRNSHAPLEVDLVHTMLAHAKEVE
jgi:hypothetical protein